MNKLLRTSTLIMGIVLFCSNAFGQVMIEQGKVVIKANPGETIVNSLPIHNTSKDRSLNLRVYWEDFTYVAPYDGTKEFVAAGTSDRSCSRWINFSPQQLTLDKVNSRKISYSIQVPPNAKGGYYGVLFLEEGGGKVEGRIGVSLVTRVGGLFFIETTDSTRTAKIDNFQFTEKELKADFTNTGDVILIPDSTFYIMDKDGLVVERGEIKKFYLPPGKTTSFKVESASKYAAGDYTMVMTFDFGDGQNVTQEFDFHKAEDGKMSIIKVSS